MAELLAVVGGGVAGTTAAEVARSLNPEAHIVVFSAERELLYSRVLLPKYCEGKIPREKVFLRSPEWYAKHRIELVYDRVLHVGGGVNGVVLERVGTATVASRVLIATGGRPKNNDWYADSRAHSLQTLADADRIIASMEHAKQSGVPLKAVVIGGSFIAMEFVNILSHHGFSVEVRLRGSRLFSHLLPQAMSDVVRAHIEAQGVRVCLTASEQPVADDCCFIGVGTGLEIEVPTADPTGKDALLPEIPSERGRFMRGKEGGVLASEDLRISGWVDSDGEEQDVVRVVGDCVEFADVLAGRTHVAGNWMNAQMQGRYGGAWLAGKPIAEPYRCVTSYSINVLGMDIVALGDAAIAAEGTQVREVAHGSGFAVECWRSERLVGVTLLNANLMRPHYAKQLS